MCALQVFNNPEFGRVRTVTVGNTPYFVGKDIAEILGYSNPRDALSKHVDEEDKTNGVAIRDSIGRDQFPVLINESGIYSLILSSKLPNAKRFKHWVTSEVLPTVRKHGAYMTPDKIEEVLMNPDTIIQLANTLKEERKRNLALSEQIEQDKPKVIFADAVSSSKSSILVGALAKLLKQNGVEIGQKRLFAWLRDNGYLIKQKGSDWNMPTQSSMERGLFEIKESTHLDGNGCNITTKTTKVTGKGQQYFINLFLSDAEPLKYSV